MADSSDLGLSVDSAPSLPFELEALANAERYQSWVFSKVRPYLGKRILEIGAGVGNLSRWLPVDERLILTEADPTLSAILSRAFASQSAGGPGNPRVTIEEFDVLRDSIDRFAAERLDTVISFNVLEHIADDVTALRKLCELLRRSEAVGPRRLVCFLPAHPWAFGTMDATFGHFRRYSAKRLRELAKQVAPEARIVALRHFNVLGLAGWWFQGRVLMRKSFGLSSVKAFESILPFWRPVDDFLHDGLRLPMGQSVYVVLEW